MSERRPKKALSKLPRRRYTPSNLSKHDPLIKLASYFCFTPWIPKFCRSNNLASTERRRGLFQDSPAAETDEVVAHDSFIVAEHIPERPVPPSPFLVDQNEGQDFLPPPPLNDENTPPPKRRRVISTDTDAEMPAEEEEMALRVTTEPAVDQTTTTWFTPIRPTRPPVADPEFTPTGMPSRVPSFAMWIDGVEIPEDDLLPVGAATTAAPSAPLPPASKDPTPTPAKCGTGGGVDMTDLARLYDPQMAAAVAKSPPTPIEKLCKSLTQ